MTAPHARPLFAIGSRTKALALVVLPLGLAQADAGPGDAVRAAVRALREGDVAAFYRCVSTDAELERAARTWSEWAGSVPADGAAELDALLAALRSTGATQALLAELEGELPGIAEGWREVVVRVASEVDASVAQLALDPARADALVTANAALRERALALDLADPEKAEAAAVALVGGARALRFDSVAELKELSFDEALREASTLLRTAKELLAIYGAEVDAVLDSAQVRVASEDETSALVELTFEVAGRRRAPGRIPMTRVDGRWVPVRGKNRDAGAPLRMAAVLLPSALELPRSSSAAPFAWSDDPVRPVVRVLASGAIVAGGHACEPTATRAEMTALRAWLAGQADAMEKAPAPVERLPPLPSSPLLFRADARAPFERVLTLMTLCGSADVRIADLRLAALREDGEPGMIPIPLPTDVGWDEREEPLSVLVRTLPGGVLELAAPGRHTRDRATLGRWFVELLQEPGKSVTLEIGSRVPTGDVVLVLDACAQARVDAVLFVGRM